MRRHICAFALFIAASGQASAASFADDFGSGVEELWSSIGELQACSVLLPHDAYKHYSAADGHQEAIDRIADAAGLELTSQPSLAMKKISLGRYMATMSLTAKSMTPAKRAASCESTRKDADAQRKYLLKLATGR